MPDDQELSNEAHKVASEAVDAVEAFAQAAITLPADVARLALTTLHKAVNEAEKIIGRAAGK